MAHNKIGFHVAANCGGCGGIETYWQKLDAAGIPFVAYSANDAGLITQAAKYDQATLVYRDVQASTVDPPDYDWDPSQAAIAYWEATKLALPISIREWKYRCWIELLNEPGKEGQQADWVGWLMFHMAALALADGYKVMGPGWSAGTPEPHHWREPGWRAYLMLCAAYPENAAVSLHEYSLDNDIHHMEPWLIGRFSHLLDACDEMGIAYPKIFITEAGWTLNSMPPDAQAKADIAYLAGLYAAEYAIQGANLWTLQAGAGNGDLPARLNALMPWLADYSLTATFPDPDIPPTEPDEPAGEEMVNYLNNGSFEGEWADATAFPGHIPEGWAVQYNTGDKYPNPYGQPYKNGEAVKKHQGMLPAEEQSLFVWDGEWTYKIFGGGTKSFWFQMSQTVSLPEGEYRLTVPVWVDHYHWKGFKDYNVDPDQSQIMIALDGVSTGRVSLPAGARQVFPILFTHNGGPLAIEIHLISNWDINGNFWLDGLTLEMVDEPPSPPPPPPSKHKAIVVKLPQDMTADEWRAAADYAFPFRHTMTASHDDMLTVLDGGNEDSYVKLAWPERQPDVGALITEAGYSWEPIFYNPPAAFQFNTYPVEGQRVITQGFGARPEVYAPLGFPGHEGVDLPATLGTPVRAVAAGTVSKVTTTGNYGNRIDVLHEGGWRTTYAHLKGFAGLTVGMAVAAGTVLGYAGSTGNSTGVHLHLGLKRDGYTYTDPQGTVWPFNIFDPSPYLAPFMMAAGLDLLPYLKGDGRMYEVKHPSGATETFQTQTDGDDWFYQVKNGAWEQLYADTGHIWRGADTSPGGGRFYVQYEPGLKRARWMPRFMTPGQSWIGPGHYVQFYMKDDCSKSALNSGNAVNVMTFVAKHAAMTWNGITVPDVAQLSNGTETWYFGRGYGLVAWSSDWGSSAICETYEPGERAALVREKIDCQY